MGATALVRLKGLSAEGLRADLETRASSTPESLELALTEWNKLLANADDTPRYENPSGDAAMTYRTAFLASKAYELCLQTAATGLASGRSCASKPALAQCGAWQGFAKASTLPGCDGLLLQLPALLAESRAYEAGRWAGEVALALKADAQSEHLRSQRGLAAQRAEQLRAQLRDQPAATSPAAAEDHCRASADAVRHYLGFRVGLDEASARLQRLAEERRQKMQEAQQSLEAMARAARERAGAAEAQREAILKDRAAALEAPKKALEEFEKDPKQVESEDQIRQLEEQRRQLLQELEVASQQLGQERQQRLQLLSQREAHTSTCRAKSEQLERELQELRPAKFYKVLAARAASMTEGEILTALKRCTERLRSTAQRFQAAGLEHHNAQRLELQRQRQGVEQQAREALQYHAQIELGHLDAAAQTARRCVASLLDVARARADLVARGLSPELEQLYSVAAMPRRQDMRELRAALSSAECAWNEATAFWSQDTAKVKEFASTVLPQLEAARERLARVVEELSVDPALYELAMSEDGQAPEVHDSGLPHGWEALVTEDDGEVYYHNLVAGSTQWELPTQDAAVCAGWRLFQAEDGGWFYHNPYDGNSLWWPGLPTYPAQPDSLESLQKEAEEG
ncbi:unnamed protein product [Effrenium voratum]|nr:unnamed protein product [Effrenium voratum]